MMAGAAARGLTCLFSIALASSCTIASGHVRPEHPLLAGERGRTDLEVRRRDVVVWDGDAPRDAPEVRALRAQIAQAASAQVGGTAVVVDGKRFRMDCSGVARGIYAAAGVRLGTVALDVSTNDTRVLFELVKRGGSLRRTHPLPGDLAFFDDTWDQNGNGLRDDPLSHVAVVERVLDHGTVILVHRVGSRIVRAYMTLADPHTRHDARGRPLNHFLRAAEGAAAAKTTAELFVAFGSLALQDHPTRVAAGSPSRAR